MKCSVEDCLKDNFAKGFCQMHYARVWRHNDLRTLPETRPQTCRVDGCDRKKRSNGYCHMHGERLRKTGDLGPSGPVKSIIKIKGQNPSSNEAAIYFLRNNEGVPFYVGSTMDPKERATGHRKVFGEGFEMIITRCVPLSETVYWEAKTLVEMVEAGFELENSCVPVEHQSRRKREVT